MFVAIMCTLLIIIGTGVFIRFNNLKKSNKFPSQDSDFAIGRAIGAGTFIVGLVAGIFQFFIIVGPGTAVTTEVLGTVDDIVLYSGVNIINPICTTRKFNIKTQEVTKTLKMPAKDQMEVAVDVTIQFRLNASNLAIMREKIGPSEKDFDNVIFNPALRGCFRDAAANFDSAELYITKRGEFQINVMTNLQEKVKDMYIIEDVIIRNVTPPAKIVEAITNKQKAQQEAQAMVFVLQKSEQEAEKLVIEAKGIADAQDIIAKKLTPEYLAWYKIDMMRELVNSPNNTVIFIPDDIQTIPMMMGK